jgi:peptidylprolyl isomerase
VATSRRRERELARRRFERRRQAELERRARMKRRNTIIGAVTGTAVVIAVVVVVAIVLVGGGSKKKPAAVKPATTPTASTTPAPAAPTKCAKIKPDPPAKGQPTIPQVTGKLTNKLVARNVKTGHGPAAKKGDTLKVTYIGVSCDDGQVFDASYKHPPVKPITVSPLGTASVIPGWNEGLIGIRAGGVRELVIPAALGYGTTGSPPTIPGNDTLVFLVTAKSVTPAKAASK